MIHQELTLTTSKFDAALDRVTREVEQKSQRMRKSFRGASSGGGIGGALAGGIANAGTDLLGAAGLGGGAAGIGMAIKGSLSYADDLADLTLKLNDSAEALQRVDYAARLAGAGGVEEVGNAFVKLERALGDVENAKAAEALANLGLTAESLASMSLDEKILAFSDAFEKARASGTGMADIQALLGRSAAELVPLFEQGGDALRAMFADAPVIAEETVQQMAAVNDQIDAMILKAKSWSVNAVGGLTGINAFLTDFYSGLLKGEGISGAIDEALLKVADRDTAALQAKADRDRQREAQGKALGASQEKAAAASAESAEIDAADKAEEEILKRRAESAKERERAMAEYARLQFEQSSPEEQARILNERIAASLGRRVTDPEQIEAAADELAANGRIGAATSVRENLARLRSISERAGGAERTAPIEQGSFAGLMDQIFGRGTPEETLAEIKNGNSKAETSAKYLGEILQKMKEPPPTSTFSDFGV